MRRSEPLRLFPAARTRCCLAAGAGAAAAGWCIRAGRAMLALARPPRPRPRPDQLALPLLACKPSSAPLCPCLQRAACGAAARFCRRRPVDGKLGAGVAGERSMWGLRCATHRPWWGAKHWGWPRLQSCSHQDRRAPATGQLGAVRIAERRCDVHDTRHMTMRPDALLSDGLLHHVSR